MGLSRDVFKVPTARGQPAQKTHGPITARTGPHRRDGGADGLGHVRRPDARLRGSDAPRSRIVRGDGMRFGRKTNFGGNLGFLGAVRRDPAATVPPANFLPRGRGHFARLSGASIRPSQPGSASPRGPASPNRRAVPRIAGPASPNHQIGTAMLTAEPANRLPNRRLRTLFRPFVGSDRPENGQSRYLRASHGAVAESRADPLKTLIYPRLPPFQNHAGSAIVGIMLSLLMALQPLHRSCTLSHEWSPPLAIGVMWSMLG